jgi:Ca2+-binding RTX toxin-like protein
MDIGLMRRIALALATLVVAGLALAAHAEAYVYWANLSGSIGRATLQGTGANQTFIGGANEALAVDDKHIYWTTVTPDGSTIGRANIGGNKVNPNFITGIRQWVAGFAVDSKYIYWPDILPNGQATIARANKSDGSGVNKQFISLPGGTGPAATDVRTVAVDSAHVYWGDINAGTIGRASVDGTGTLDPSFISTGVGPWDIAIAAKSIYWANPYRDTIGRASLGGGNVNQAFISTAPNESNGVAVDAHHLYWSSYGIPTSAIGRSTLGGNKIQRTWIPGAQGPRGVAVDALPAACADTDATIAGTGGSDKLRGTNGDDVIAARGGDDTVVGLGGNDLVCGAGGDDELRGGGGDDELRGGGGDDELRGGGGSDRCRGGEGSDDDPGC